jgi:hypothetical protein
VSGFAKIRSPSQSMSRARQFFWIDDPRRLLYVGRSNSPAIVRGVGRGQKSSTQSRPVVVRANYKNFECRCQSNVCSALTAYKYLLFLKASQQLWGNIIPVD